ncbi:VWA domain-containing protein [bacterium]|nr:VWA domain-containing protein [bacterium]
MRFACTVLLGAVLFCSQLSAQVGNGVDITDIDISQFPTVVLAVKLQRATSNSSKPTVNNAYLEENGIPQIVEAFDCPEDSSIRLSVAILVDRSNSMLRNAANIVDSVKIKEATAAVEVFLDLLTSRDEAAIYGFSATAGNRVHRFIVDHDFSSDIASLKASLYPIYAEGRTFLWDAIVDALDQLKSRAGRRVLIVLTDGRDRSTTNDLSDVIRKAQTENIPVYPIALGEDIDEGSLRSLASATGGRYMPSPTASELKDIFLQLGAELLTDDCVLRYTSSNPCLDGSLRNVNLTLAGLGFVGEADTFYNVENKLIPATLRLGPVAGVVAKDSVAVPVNIFERLSITQPLSYALTINYDASLMQFLHISTVGTMSAGGNVQVTEVIPGELRIALNNFVPAFSSGTLLQVMFSTYSRSDDVQTRMEIVDGKLFALCPMIVSMEGSSLEIRACEEQFLLSSDTVLVSDGDIVEIPVYLSPVPEDGQYYELGMEILDPSPSLIFEDVMTAGTMLEDGDLLLQPNDGRLEVTARLTGSGNADSVLFILRYSAVGTKDVQFIPLTLSFSDIQSNCAIRSSVEQPVVIIDGICRPLLRRREPELNLANFPNPFNGKTSISYTVPHDGQVRLQLLDAQGRLVHTLLEAYLTAGSYLHQVDLPQLSPGEYLIVLTFGEQQTVRGVLNLR